MNKRQYDIIKTLYNNNEFVTLRFLADAMDVSVKTVRNDIAAIKEQLPREDMLETKPHVGVRLTMTENEFKSLSNGADDSEREIMFFIFRHLFKNNSLTAQRLAQQYYIGRIQLDKILEKASHWFSKRHIVFETKRGKGISIRYSEFNYRTALLSFVTEYSKEFSELITMREPRFAAMGSMEYTALCAALDGFEADRAAKAVLETEAEFGLKLNALSEINLLFFVSLSIVRSRKGCEVSMPKTVKCPSDGKSDALMAKSLCKRLEEEFNITFSDEELSYVTFAVAISEIADFNDGEHKRSFELSNFELCRLTVKTANLISRAVDVNLSTDRFFVNHMLTQLKVTIARLKYGINFKNQLLSQIKEKYPNMMAAAWLLSGLFEKELKLELNEHEVGYFALHIGGAIERQLSCLTACIVCDYGIGISQILKEKITRTIPGLNITSVFSVRDIRSIKNEKCDFIITTTSLSGYRINQDIVTVGHLLTEDDIKTLEDYMKNLRLKKRGGIQNIIPGTGIFNKELLFPNCGIIDKSELLHMLCQKLEALGYVTAKFEKSVFEREAATATDIGKGFAIPHGLSKYVNRSAAAFVSLEKPIQWTENGEYADIIFLLAFDLDESEETKQEIISFYKSIVTFTEDDKSCENLRKLTDKDEIMKILKFW